MIDSLYPANRRCSQPIDRVVQHTQAGFRLASLRTLQACLAICLAGVLMVHTSSAQSASAKNWAGEMFSGQDHDFNAVGVGAKCEYHFDFKNLYEEDVHVASVRSSCGCTIPSVTKDTLKTHETAAIVAKFNTTSFVGHKEATITVVFDKPYYAEVRLKVKGFIRTDVMFDPAEVNVGEIAAGESAKENVTVTYNGRLNWNITDVRSHCDHLQVQLGKPVRTVGRVQIPMTVTIKPSMPEGDMRHVLTLVSNDPNYPTTDLMIRGRVRPAVSVSPAALGFGTAKPGDAVEKRLVVRADTPFAISEILCSDERFEFKYPEGEKKLHFVKVKFNAGEAEDRIGQEVRIVTNLEGGKSAKCIVTAVVQ